MPLESGQEQELSEDEIRQILIECNRKGIFGMIRGDINNGRYFNPSLKLMDRDGLNDQSPAGKVFDKLSDFYEGLYQVGELTDSDHELVNIMQNQVYRSVVLGYYGITEDMTWSDAKSKIGGASQSYNFDRIRFPKNDIVAATARNIKAASLKNGNQK